MKIRINPIPVVEGEKFAVCGELRDDTGMLCYTWQTAPVYESLLDAKIAIVDYMLWARRNTVLPEPGAFIEPWPSEAFR
jgi:hypothetical protein